MRSAVALSQGLIMLQKCQVTCTLSPVGCHSRHCLRENKWKGKVYVARHVRPWLAASRSLYRGDIVFKVSCCASYACLLMSTSQIRDLHHVSHLYSGQTQAQTDMPLFGLTCMTNSHNPGASSLSTAAKMADLGSIYLGCRLYFIKVRIGACRSCLLGISTAKF